tara:strand:+ start:3200 stop:3496 length:297 start_codon:yes stop_codon:yes gene_type:complete
MNKKCKECREKKDLIEFTMYRDSFDRIKYTNICKKCRAKNIRDKRKTEKVLQVYLDKHFDPLEQASDAFKDDPRAATEQDYGRVVKKPTYYPKGGLVD